MRNLLIFAIGISSFWNFGTYSLQNYELIVRRLKQSNSDIESRINLALAAKLAQLKAALVLQDFALAQKIINEINSYKANPDNLEIADVLNVYDFFTSLEYPTYREKALRAVIEGNYAIEMFFAGAATRLRSSLEEVLGKDLADKLAGPMYFVDIWKIAEALGYEVPEHAIRGIGMGPRQLIQLNVKLKWLAQEAGVEPQEVLDRQKIILHINSEIENRVREDLIRHNFYGFNPQNVIILVQPVLEGYTIEENNQIVVVEGSRRYPYGHGYAFEQIAKKAQGYRIDKANESHYLSESVIGFLRREGVQILVIGRINDLTKFSSQIIDLDKLAFGLKLIDDGYNIVTEIVYNPQAQKGGIFLKDKQTGKQFFLENLSLQTDMLQTRLDELRFEVRSQGIPSLPNSVTRTIFNLEDLEKILSAPLPVNLRIRDKGYIYPELLWGDVTHLGSANTVGIMKGEEFIQDFKELKDLGLAIEYLSAQDENEDFRRVAERYLFR